MTRLAMEGSMHCRNPKEGLDPILRPRFEAGLSIVVGPLEARQSP